MGWQVLIIINLVFGSLREFLSKIIVNKIEPWIVIFYITFLNGILFFIFQFSAFGRWPRFDLSVTLSGIIFVVAFVSYFAAVKISLSQSILFQSYSLIITILLAAVFLGEARYFNIKTLLGLKIIAGIVLAFVSLWLVLYEGGKKEQLLERRWFFYIALTILFLGTGSFISIYFSKQLEPVEVFINQTLTMLPVLVFLLIIQKKSIKVPVSMVKYILAYSVVSVVAVLAFYQALKYIAVSRYLPMQQVLLVIITMMVGIFYFKEAKIFTGKRLVGMILGLIGIILLVTS